ncbi:MAG: response regulator transcription factor [Mariprofundaceae bacterium]|nr:response regulator transcription factor [Mariprofundaceae bacterium]
MNVETFPDNGNRTENILVIDDDPLICEILATMLARQGYSAESAADINAARTYVSRDSFDLVFLDIVFPGQKHSGFDIMNCIREYQPDCPVVLITAYPSTETAVEALHQNAFDYLMKPLKLEEVETVTNRALQYKGKPDGMMPSNERIGVKNPGGLQLTDRERDILGLLAKGLSFHEMALHFGCKISSVQTHTKQIYRKLGVHSRAAAVHEALQLKIIRI